MNKGQLPSNSFSQQLLLLNKELDMEELINFTLNDNPVIMTINGERTLLGFCAPI